MPKISARDKKAARDDAVKKELIQRNTEFEEKSRKIKTSEEAGALLKELERPVKIGKTSVNLGEVNTKESIENGNNINKLSQLFNKFQKEEKEEKVQEQEETKKNVEEVQQLFEEEEEINRVLVHLNFPGSDSYKKLEADIQQQKLLITKTETDLKNLVDEIGKAKNDAENDRVSLQTIENDPEIVKPKLYESIEVEDKQFHSETGDGKRTRTVTEPVEGAFQLKADWESALEKKHPGYLELKEKVERQNTILEADYLPNQERSSKNTIFRATQAIATKQRSLLPQFKISDEAFDDLSLLKEPVKKRMEALGVTKDHIKDIENLHGIKKCLEAELPSIRKNVSPPIQEDVDGLIKTASFDKISPPRAGDTIKIIQNHISRVISSLESEQSKAESAYTSSKKTGLAGALQFFKNVISAIKNEDKSEKPFLERFKEINTADETKHIAESKNYKERITELKTLESHVVPLPIDDTASKEKDEQDIEGSSMSPQ